MLRVLVVGAGLAGLSAAVSLRRAGHLVHIYERSGMNNEVGAAINVPPNATRFLVAWGLDPARWGFVKSRLLTFNDPFTMETTAVTYNSGTAREIGGSELYYAHRVDLHNALKWMATREDGPGEPVAIHLKAPVVGYSPDEPSITLSSGETIRGDVVIGADGVHSTASEAVLGRSKEPVVPVHSNYAFRFLISADVLEQDPETIFFNQDRDGWIRLFVHNDTKRRVVTYPCRDNTVHNLVGLFYDEEIAKGKREDWQAGVPVSDVLEKYSDFCPQLLKVISKATEVKRWPLLYRHPIPTWTKGRMALAGDSAHPMLPHQAQGGAQGMEDGLVLGIVLHGASSPDEVEERLEIYERIRRNRASAIQILSNAGADQTHLVREELMQFLAPDQIPGSPAEIYKYCFGYDVVKDTLGVMREYDGSFGLPADFFEHEVMGVPDPRG